MTSALRHDSNAQPTTSTNLKVNVPLTKSVDLSHSNTMALACVADMVVTLTDEAQLDAVMAHYGNGAELTAPSFVRCGGSNILLPAHLDAIVLRPQMRGIIMSAQSDSHVDIEVMAGENWHDLVMYSVAQGW